MLLLKERAGSCLVKPILTLRNICHAQWGSECNIPPIWWYCISILLKVLNLKILLIKLVDEDLRSFLPLKNWCRTPHFCRVRARGRSVACGRQEHIMESEHSLCRSHFYVERQSLFVRSSACVFTLKML